MAYVEPIEIKRLQIPLEQAWRHNAPPFTPPPRQSPRDMSTPKLALPASRNELYKMAKDLKIPGRSLMSKGELISSIWIDEGPRWFVGADHWPGASIFQVMYICICGNISDITRSAMMVDHTVLNPSMSADIKPSLHCMNPDCLWHIWGRLADVPDEWGETAKRCTYRYRAYDPAKDRKNIQRLNPHWR